MSNIICLKCRIDKKNEEKNHKIELVNKNAKLAPSWSGKHWLGCPYFEPKTTLDLMLLEELYEELGLTKKERSKKNKNF